MNKTNRKSDATTTTVDEIIAAIATIDLAGCRAVRAAAEQRATEIREVESQRRVTERWSALERCKPGTTLYVGGIGRIRIGSRVQTGDSFKVVRVDKNRERMDLKLWRIKGKQVRADERYTVGPDEAARLELSRSKPTRDATDGDRRVGRDLASMMAEAKV